MTLWSGLVVLALLHQIGNTRGKKRRNRFVCTSLFYIAQLFVLQEEFKYHLIISLLATFDKNS